MSGLTTAGFTPKSLEEIKAEIVADVLSNVDAKFDLSPDQPVGQLVTIFAQREAKLWELLAVAYGGADPRDAEGFLLDGVCLLTGTNREPSRRTVVQASCVLGAAFSAAAGTMFASITGSSPAVLFRNVGPVTSTTAGTYMAAFEAAEYGPIACNAGTLTTIAAPVSGWTSVTNPTDGAKGALTEQDDSLRKRREDELSAAGACTSDSLRADLLQITHTDGTSPVQQAFVFENTSLVTDSNGLPAKSFEAVIFDGLTPAATDAEVAQTVFDGKPSGIEPYGAVSAVAYDTKSRPYTVKFSRATVKNVYLDLPGVVVDATQFPATGIDLIKAAIVAYGESTLNLGVDVISKKVAAAALTVPGVIDVPTVYLGFAAAPAGAANLGISLREIASLDTSRITATSVAGTP